MGLLANEIQIYRLNLGVLFLGLDLPDMKAVEFLTVGLGVKSIICIVELLVM
jgi:hypothetical protein